MLLEQPNMQASDEATTTTSTETIFKPKIESIELDSLKLDTLVEQPEVKKTKQAEKPALVDSTNSEAKSAEASASIESSSTEEQTEASETASTEVTESNAVEPEESQIVLSPDTSTTDETENADVAAGEDDNQSTAEAIAKVAEKGWTVRVGTFVKKENVSSVSALLDNNGFSTNHTEVETTLGKATRVWLGPYADKETAEKVSTRLKSITGEKGYVATQS